MLLKLLHKLKLIKLIWLIDHEQEVYLTWVDRDTPFGLVCNIYPFTRTGKVLLNPDGTTSGPSSYIKYWKPYESNW